MSTTAIGEHDSGSLGLAPACGWISGVMTGSAVLALYVLSTVATQPPATVGEWPAVITSLLWALAMTVIVGAIIALPAPFLGAGLLRLLPARTLRMWLASGLLSSLPSAGFVWYLCTTLNAWTVSDGPGPEPFAWYNLQLPSLVLFCGLAGGYFAWRYWRSEAAR